MTTRTYGRHRIELSNLDKVFFPDAGIAKGDLVDYYERIADWMIPHMKSRPLSLERFPDGFEGEGFYQKQTPDYFPDWITTVSIPMKGEGGSQSQVVCNGKATLVYLANQACITPHIWLSRKDRLDVPDRMVFDLDPPGDDFDRVRDAAQRLREILQELELDSFLMLTGSKGAHVVVPLRRRESFDGVRAIAQVIAGRLADAQPEELTTEQRKDARGERVFLDTARNAYGQTTVAPYAVRARRGAPVATPIDWEELPGVTASQYNIQTVLRRLSQKADPWHDIGNHAQGLAKAREKMKQFEESV